MFSLEILLFSVSSNINPYRTALKKESFTSSSNNKRFYWNSSEHLPLPANSSNSTLFLSSIKNISDCKSLVSRWDLSSLSSSRFVHLKLLLQNLYSPSQEETIGFLLTSVTIMPILSNLLERQLLLVIPLTVTLFIRSFLFSPLTISLKNLQTLALVIQTLLLLSCIIW